VLAFTAPGATLFPQYIGDVGQVTTRATIHNQHGQLVLDGEHTYLLKTAQQTASKATS
jgi:acyl dehydratase